MTKKDNTCIKFVQNSGVNSGGTMSAELFYFVFVLILCIIVQIPRKWCAWKKKKQTKMDHFVFFMVRA